MAGVLKVRTVVNLTGLGDEVSIDTGDVTMTVPVERQEGYTVTAAWQAGEAGAAIQLFDMVDHIALAKIYGVFIKAVSGTIYILPDTAGTTPLTSSTAQFTLNVGEGHWFAINPSGNLGLVIDGASATDAFSWMIVGKA